MDLNEAINDPSRPLSVHPDEWIKQKETMRRGSVNDETNISEMDPLSKIDNAIDGFVSDIKLLTEGLDEVDMKALSPDERKILNNVRELLDTAIAPYVAEAAIEIEKLETGE